MNIGIISDIHGNYNALEKVITDMKKNNINSVIVLGDIIFSGDEPQKCFDTVQALKPIVWIRGNTDDWFNEIDESFRPNNEVEVRIYKEYLKVNKKISAEVGETIKKLKEKEEVCIEGKQIMCVHGSDKRINEPIGIMTPQKDMYEIFHRLQCDILLCGHTHSPYSATYDGKLIFNVGSVGMPKDETRGSYGILIFNGDNFEYIIRRVKIE